MKLEIERKWLLLEPPPTIQLGTRADQTIFITQTYITLPEPGSHRVRQSVINEDKIYEMVTKVKVETGVNEETTHSLTLAEYEDLLKLQTPGTITINKTRFVIFVEDDLKIEVDSFKNPKGMVTAEIEFPSIETFRESFTLPTWLGPAVDVTDDSRYSNASIARTGRAPEGNSS